jgi:hypothetical protein
MASAPSGVQSTPAQPSGHAVSYCYFERLLYTLPLAYSFCRQGSFQDTASRSNSRDDRYVGPSSSQLRLGRWGEVEIERDGKIVEQLGPRGIFGEMTPIDGAPCAATATTKTACEVAPITEKASLFLVHETPFFAISVMRDLGDR